jgi:hypothetical protein
MSRGAWTIVALTGCSQVFGLDVPTRVPADASAIADAPAAWSAAEEITELNAGRGDDDPCLTGDLLEIVFSSKRAPDGGEDIYYARREAPGGPWGPAMAAVDLNSSQLDTTPKITPDGLSIFLSSNRDGPVDVYFAQRASRAAAWSMPVRVVELSSAADDYGATTNDARTHLVLGTGNPTAIYRSDRDGSTDPWRAPRPIGELDAPNVTELDPFEPNETAIYFSTGGDIHVARRTGAGTQYGPAAPLVGPNSNAVDRDPWLSADERHLFFSSTRSGVSRLYYSEYR